MYSRPLSYIVVVRFIPLCYQSNSYKLKHLFECWVFCFITKHSCLFMLKLISHVVLKGRSGLLERCEPISFVTRDGNTELLLDWAVYLSVNLPQLLLLNKSIPSSYVRWVWTNVKVQQVKGIHASLFLVSSWYVWGKAEATHIASLS